LEDKVASIDVDWFIFLYLEAGQGKKKNAQNGPGQENQEREKYTKSRNA